MTNKSRGEQFATAVDEEVKAGTVRMNALNGSVDVYNGHSWTTTTAAHTNNPYGTVTLGSYGGVAASTVTTKPPRMKSTQELMEERDEEVTELAMQFENILSDQLPDATKEQIRTMSKDITATIYDAVHKRWFEEKSAGYTVNL